MARINTLSGGFTGYTSITAASKDEPEYLNTTMAFAQSTTPVGWTKQTAYNDYAIRVVSGIPSSGGSSNFSTIFSSQAALNPVSGSWPASVGTTTITTETMQSHAHPGSRSGGTPTTGRISTPYYNPLVPSTASVIGGAVYGTPNYPYTSDSTGSGGGHAHTATITDISVSSTVNLSIKYMDVLLAEYR